ncbi:MAG: hypothetical protein JWP37_2761 [Mucilaginibacter sp.]|nr:hypothetical protein [Mucilaginibacter sp.]
MKNYRLVFISLCLLLYSCAQPIIYTGQKLPPTKSVDVFYTGETITRHYKVIGHMISHHYADDIVKKELMRYAKSIGADAVIIIGVDTSVTGKPNRVAADALKYE